MDEEVNYKATLPMKHYRQDVEKIRSVYSAAHVIFKGRCIF